jgi:hypothetical protein
MNENHNTTYPKQTQLQEKDHPAVEEKKLLLFELNRILIEHRHRTEFKLHIYPNKHDFVTKKNLFVFIRPNTKDFLEFVFEHFDIGFWSSMTREDTYDILINLLSRKQIDSVKMVLTQEDCSTFGDYVKDTRKPIYYKIVDRLWTNSNETKCYKKENVLLIDDSSYKSIFNPPHVSIHPKVFNLLNLEKKDSELMRLQKYLKHSLNVSSLHSYVRQNPYDAFDKPETETETETTPYRRFQIKTWFARLFERMCSPRQVYFE